MFINYDLSTVCSLLFCSINDRSVFGNSPGPRPIRRALAPASTAGPHYSEWIGLVDDAGTLIVHFQCFI